ncbi:MAG: GAF domain-containing protein [Candidatus Promineifilaceae bacterium]
MLPSRTVSDQSDYERLQLLYTVNDMLRRAEADGLDIAVILPRILRLSAQQLKASLGSIIIIDATRSVEYSWNVDGDADYQTDYVPFVGEVVKAGIAGLAIRNYQTICIKNTLDDERWLPRPGHVTNNSAWSAVCTPLIVNKRAVGAITITKPGIAQFAHEDVDLLRIIASQAAINVENARLHTSLQRQLREAELFNLASKEINESLKFDKIMQSMLSGMNELLNAEAISVALVEGSELVYTVADGAGSDEILGLRLPSAQGVSGWVMKNAKPALVNDPENDPRFSNNGDRRTGHTTQAMICAPLRANGRVLGTIQAINPPAGKFTKDDLRVLVRIAGLASSAFSKSEQYKLVQEAESRYLNLFEDSVDPIIITSPEGIIREVNHRTAEFLDYERVQLIGESIDILHQHPILTDLPNSSEQSLTEVHMLERRALTRTGDLVPVEVYVKRSTGPTHDELQWIYHDISEQRELEQMREDLTAMLFHDLQNPLSNVISSLELLDSDLLPEDADPIASMMITVAFRSSQRLRHLIRSLLDINQLEAGSPVHEKDCHSIAEMFDYIGEMMEVPIQTKGVTFNPVVGENLPELFINRDMIERVIINLFDNSIKFSKRADIITLSATEQDGKILFSLSDQGPGIPAQFRASVFDKFYRTPDNTSKGMGLGLAFCRLAVEAHGGHIWASEAEGGGAQFNFVIPVTACP